MAQAATAVAVAGVAAAAAAADDAAAAESCSTFYFAGTNTYYLMVRGSEPKTQCEVVEVL